MRPLLLSFFILSGFSLHFAQAQEIDSASIYNNWQLNEKTHQLLLPDLPKKLDKKLQLLQINYKEGESRLTDFYTLGEATFYQKRKNPFRINKTRYSGTLVGIDEDKDISFEIEFLKGKLDGYFIVYQTDGSIVTKVYQKNLLKSKIVQTPEEFARDPSLSPYQRKLRKLRRR